jgi:hypothetical protein
MSEKNPAVLVLSLAVRAAMPFGFEHAGEGVSLGVSDETSGAEYSGDATHGLRNYFSFRS